MVGNFHKRQKLKKKNLQVVACKRRLVSGCRLSRVTSDSRKYVCVRRLFKWKPGEKITLVLSTLQGLSLNQNYSCTTWRLGKNFNKVRGITLGIQPIWGINSFTLQPLFDPTMFYRMGSFLYLPRGLETPIWKEQGKSLEILKRYSDPVGVAWTFFHL